MDKRKQLELLELLESMPMPPDIAPMPTVRNEDPFVIIPKSIREYLKGIGHEPDTEPDGRISAEKYLQLLDELGINTHEIKMIRTAKESK